jgi:enamine deaminase RidA (YjgF/YER057c/UK114 family)
MPLPSRTACTWLPRGSAKNAEHPWWITDSKETIVSAEAKLKELNIDLPPVPKPAGNYVAGVQVGDLLFMSGCGPRRNDGTTIAGKLGADVTTQQGYEAARVVGLNMLANIRSVIGSLDRVERVVKVLGMVNATPDFNETPKVINGFSDLFVEVFGAERGRGARSAVGMVMLPNQIAVEVEMVLQVRN